MKTSIASRTIAMLTLFISLHLHRYILSSPYELRRQANTLSLKELMGIFQTQEFGSFMKMTGNFSFVMNQHQWRIEKKLAGGGAMMDLGIYVVQAAIQAANANHFHE